MYELRHKTLSLRVPDEPPARLAAVLGLTGGADNRDRRRAAPTTRGRYAARFVSPQGKRRKPTPPARNVRAARDVRAERSRHKLAALAAFAIFVVGSLIVVAAAQGLGGLESVEGDIAVIEDAPDGTITSEDFDRALEQTAASGAARGAAPTTSSTSPRRRRRLRPDPLALGARRGRGARDRGHRSRGRGGAETVINQQFDPRTRSRSSSTNPASRWRRRRTSASRCSWSPTGSSRRSCRRSRRSPRTSPHVLRREHHPVRAARGARRPRDPDQERGRRRGGRRRARGGLLAAVVQGSREGVLDRRGDAEHRRLREAVVQGQSGAAYSTRSSAPGRESWLGRSRATRAST